MVNTIDLLDQFGYSEGMRDHDPTQTPLFLEDSFLEAEPKAAPAALEPLTVAQLSLRIKQTIEGSFSEVWVRGELSAVKLHGSGHLYFTLKDQDAVIDGICWRGTVGQLRLAPVDGLEVLCRGRVTTYGARSKYQIIVERMEISGEGSLLKLIQERKEKLQKEGLFDLSRKKPLPFIPERIAIITSPTGAVIQDIVHRLRERFPCPVLLWPVAVQGPSAPQEIIAALKGLNDESSHLPPVDVIIVARGGGSLEDLWGFNDEALVRAVAASRIPVISAVGHETDTTLVDFAADRRAPTPTAAAEFVVPVRRNLQEGLCALENRLSRTVRMACQHQALVLERLVRGMINPKYVIDPKIQMVDDLSERLGRALETRLKWERLQVQHVGGRVSSATVNEAIRRHRDTVGRWGEVATRCVQMLVQGGRQHVNLHGGLLESYSYAQTLKRGFAVIEDGGGRVIMGVEDLAPRALIRVRMRDGAVQAEVVSSA